MYIPPHIMQNIPLELEAQWPRMSFKRTAEVLDQYHPAWKAHICRKFKVRSPLTLANRKGMNRTKLAALLRVEFDRPWVYTLFQFKEQQRAVTNIHEWLKPATEIDVPLARYLWKHRSKFSRYHRFTLPAVEQDNYFPVFFRLAGRWFYAGRQEIFHKGRGREPAMAIFLRALEQAKENQA